MKRLLSDVMCRRVTQFTWRKIEKGALPCMIQLCRYETRRKPWCKEKWKINAPRATRCTGELAMLLTLPINLFTLSRSLSSSSSTLSFSISCCAPCYTVYVSFRSSSLQLNFRQGTVFPTPASAVSFPSCLSLDHPPCPFSRFVLVIDLLDPAASAGAKIGLRFFCLVTENFLTECN